MVKLTINDGTENLTRLWNSVISKGLVPRRLDSSRLGLLLSAIATELNITTSILQSYVSQFNINTCTDRILIENMARMFAVRRLASKSKVILQFTRAGDFNESVKIPANFAVRDKSDSTIVFKTISTVYLWKGTQSVSVLAYSIGSGRKFNVPANSLTEYESGSYNTKLLVNNPSDAFGGHNDETIEHLRGRAKGFRYERDGTLQAVTRKIWMQGLRDNEWKLTEYADGPGSYEICIDTSSEEEFEDLCSALEYGKTAGIKIIFSRAERVYLNIYVHIETTGQKDYNPMQKNNIYNSVNDTIQKFFAAHCWVGNSFKKNDLKTSLNQALSSYSISSIDIDFDKGVNINEKGMITVNKTQRIYPNKILTNLDYRGD